LIENLQFLCIEYFTLSHKILETIFDFVSGKTSMREVSLLSLYCKEHGRGCKSFDLDLSQHSLLTMLDLQWLPSLQLNVTTSSLISIHLSGIRLVEGSLLLSATMVNITHLELAGTEMSSAESLQNFIKALENIPQSVTINMVKIKPDAEYENVKKYIRNSETFDVTDDNTHWPQKFLFKTIKPRTE
jgi:hypothetical protein